MVARHSHMIAITHDRDRIEHPTHVPVQTMRGHTHLFLRRAGNVRLCLEGFLRAVV